MAQHLRLLTAVAEEPSWGAKNCARISGVKVAEDRQYLCCPPAPAFIYDTILLYFALCILYLCNTKAQYSIESKVDGE